MSNQTENSIKSDCYGAFLCPNLCPSVDPMKRFGSDWCPKLVSEAKKIKKKGDQVTPFKHRICFSPTKIFGVGFYSDVRLTAVSWSRPFDHQEGRKVVQGIKVSKIRTKGVQSCWEGGFTMLRSGSNKNPQKKYFWGQLVSGGGVRGAEFLSGVPQPIDFVWRSQRDSNPCYRRERPTS
jgi:hypothetical protein